MDLCKNDYGMFRGRAKGSKGKGKDHSGSEGNYYVKLMPTTGETSVKKTFV